MRICLIGPSYPFRGGISHHTTLLYRHLRKRHEVNFYAFKRQYPRWLFPGKTDRDVSKNALQAEGAQCLLDSINPLTWWWVYKKIKKVEPDLVIIPWWSSFWTLQFWTIVSLIKRFSSARLLFICHNIVDHESHPLSKFCTRVVLAKGDHFFVHSQKDGRRLSDLLPDAVITQAFHPVYDFFSADILPKSEARRRLALEGNILLFFGFIRPYKGVDDLLDAVAIMLKRMKITLLVVGEFWGGREAFARRVTALGIEETVRVIDGYVPNEEVGLYFSAADLVALPYRSGTGSGIVQIAYGLERPVIATSVGSLTEVVVDGKTGYLVNPRDPKAFADAAIRFFTEKKESEFVENIRTAKDIFSWDHIVSLIEHSTMNENSLFKPEAPSWTSP